MDICLHVCTHTPTQMYILTFVVLQTVENYTMIYGMYTFQNAKKNGKKGTYFLENYVPVGEQPIQYNSTSGVKVLRVPYPHWYTSNIELHVNADNIAVVNFGYVYLPLFYLI